VRPPASPPTAASDPAIQARQLTRIYRLGAGSVVGISGLDLDVAAGELVVITGASGSGKSTLLALLAGLDHPSAGTLRVCGWQVAALADAELTRFRRTVVGMVFQHFNLLNGLTVLENVMLPAMLAGMPYPLARQRAERHVEQIGLADRSRHRPAQLSGGEMQRTAIARALVNDPALILADEPTGNLDSRNGRMVIELLAGLRRHGARTVIIATHSTLADDLADRQILLRDGAIVAPRGGS
jgi:ABC-type lipoprotein export system ATPase subunit